MSTNPTIQTILTELQNGTAVPYIGPGALVSCHSMDGDTPMPADSDSLILAMNNGRPMAPKLMFEFPRAAMNLELKKGRSFISRFLTELYGGQSWTRAPLHDWIAKVKPGYVIDINRDTQLQDTYSEVPHTLIRGCARLGGTDYRFIIHHYDGSTYREIPQKDVDASLPVLFKPTGSPVPDPTYIASDADFVDYITELMGGFAIPTFLKKKRKGLKYVLLGMRLTRDTERMVMSDITYDAAAPRGWALIPEASEKEKRYCQKIGLEWIDAGIDELLAASPVLDIAS